MTLDALLAAPFTAEVSGEARLGYDGWVSEFEAFRWSTGTGSAGSPDTAGPMSARPKLTGRSVPARGVSRTASSADPSTAMDKLRAEVKLLHWHKLANEAALKAALLKTKKIKARISGTSRPVPATATLSVPREERAAWMQQVIDEEQSKPLQVSKDLMRKYEEQEKLTEERLDTGVVTHIRSLKNLREQIEKRGNAMARRVIHRAAQKQLELEKQQLLLGKLGATATCAPESTCTDPREVEGARSRPEVLHQPRQGQVAPTTVGAIDTVLGSLDKLVELEKRISSLEKSNVYDDFRAKYQGGAASDTRHVPRSVGRQKVVSRLEGSEASRRRSSGGRQGGGSRNRRLSFSKTTTEARIDRPSQTYYSVRVRRKPGSTTVDSTPLKRRSRGDQNPRVEKSSSRVTSGVSTFLTQLPDVHRHPKAVERRRAGGEGFRSAIGEKKRIEAKRKLAAHRAEAVRVARQDRIICEWMKRKKAAAATGYRPSNPSSVSRLGGIPAVGRQKRRSASRGAKNEHLQEFRDIRASYAKRTENLRRDLSCRLCGSGGRALAGTRTIAIARRRVPAASFSACSQPGKSSSTNPSMQRGARVPQCSGGKMRRGHTRMTEGRRANGRRAGQGLVVGGAGLRAARGRRQEHASFGARSARRRDISFSLPRRTAAVAVLPMLR